jgi:hypothetical protein
MLVDRLHDVAGRFDAAISRSTFEIKLARMPKDSATLSAL